MSSGATQKYITGQFVVRLRILKCVYQTILNPLDPQHRIFCDNWNLFARCITDYCYHSTCKAVFILIELQFKHLQLKMYNFYQAIKHDLDSQSSYSEEIFCHYWEKFDFACSTCTCDGAQFSSFTCLTYDRYCGKEMTADDNKIWYKILIRKLLLLAPIFKYPRSINIMYIFQL